MASRKIAASTGASADRKGRSAGAVTRTSSPGGRGRDGEAVRVRGYARRAARTEKGTFCGEGVPPHPLAFGESASPSGRGWRAHSPRHLPARPPLPEGEVETAKPPG